MAKGTSPPGPRAGGEAILHEAGEDSHFIVPRASASALCLRGEALPVQEKHLFPISHFLIPFLRSAASAFLLRAALAVDNETDQKWQQGSYLG